MGFGHQLAIYRKRAELRQDVFADLLGINRSHLNQIERERAKPPRIETLVLMFGILRLELDECVSLLSAAGQLQNSQNILTVDAIENLVKVLEAFEAAGRVIGPLLAHFKNALDAAEKSLHTQLTL